MAEMPNIELPLSVTDINEILPHRYPFLLIDRVTEFREGEIIAGFKNVSANEPFFQGHFPGKPIMPGVLILEAIAQLGCIYASICASTPKAEDKLLVFSGTDKVRFRRQVGPGDRLELVADKFQYKFGHWKMEGRATVDGETAVEAVIRAAEI